MTSSTLTRSENPFGSLDDWEGENLTSFKFLHAADLHLDSPLLGLASKSPGFARRVDDASREALDNLVALAKDEGCRFVLLAGDVFDGELRDMRAGLFFVSRMRKLEEAGIDVFMVLGNHDAENRFIKKLSFSDNVYRFSTKRAETKTIEGLDVSIHGHSFSQRDVQDNIAKAYPPPTAGHFNIGVLHTACQGKEGYHASYAPCTVQQLVNHGYDYWALGHVHAQEVLNSSPYVVYPGNLQGRNPRETGAKGAMLVEVQDGRVSAIEHKALDAVRWVGLNLDVTEARDINTVLVDIRRAADGALVDAGGRPLAVRLILTGSTPLDADLRLRHHEIREEIATLFSGISDEIWLERFHLGTRPQEKPEGLDASIAGQIEGYIRSLTPDELTRRLEKRLEEVSAKYPSAARMEELFERLRHGSQSHAVELAASLLSDTGDHDAI